MPTPLSTPTTLEEAAAEIEFLRLTTRAQQNRIELLEEKAKASEEWQKKAVETLNALTKLSLETAHNTGNILVSQGVRPRVVIKANAPDSRLPSSGWLLAISDGAFVTRRCNDGRHVGLVIGLTMEANTITRLRGTTKWAQPDLGGFLVFADLWGYSANASLDDAPSKFRFSVAFCNQ
jgi:hypothetical protein